MLTAHQMLLDPAICASVLSGFSSSFADVVSAAFAQPTSTSDQGRSSQPLDVPVSTPTEPPDVPAPSPPKHETSFTEFILILGGAIILPLALMGLGLYLYERYGDLNHLQSPVTAWGS